MSYSLIEISSPNGIPYMQTIPVGDLIAAHRSNVQVREHTLKRSEVHDITPMNMVRPDHLYSLAISPDGTIRLVVANREKEILPSQTSVLIPDIPRVIVGEGQDSILSLFSCIMLSSGSNEKLQILLSVKKVRRV